MVEGHSQRTTVHRVENVLLVGELTVSEFFDGGGLPVEHPASSSDARSTARAEASKKDLIIGSTNKET
jgi:hypothetical protein